MTEPADREREERAQVQMRAFDMQAATACDADAGESGLGYEPAALTDDQGVAWAVVPVEFRAGGVCLAVPPGVASELSTALREGGGRGGAAVAPGGKCLVGRRTCRGRALQRARRGVWTLDRQCRRSTWPPMRRRPPASIRIHGGAPMRGSRIAVKQLTSSARSDHVDTWNDTGCRFLPRMYGVPAARAELSRADPLRPWAAAPMVTSKFWEMASRRSLGASLSKCM